MVLNPVCVEVVASTPEDVASAAKGGADRVEFCTHLPSGGLTPGRGLIVVALQEARSVGLGMRVLVRPREGDFVYTQKEKRAMLLEAEDLLGLGVDRIVTGGLTPQGTIDVEFLAAFERQIGMEHLVFHRAVDEVGAGAQAIQTLLDSGVRTVLTSGGKAKAHEGLAQIHAMVQIGLDVVAGAGVKPVHAEALLRCGVEGIHASCRRTEKGRSHRGLFDLQRSQVDAKEVEALVQSVRKVERP